MTNQIKNIFSDIPRTLPSELLETIAATNKMTIERIVSKGHQSPENGWYDQSKNEWVILLKGAAQITFKDEKVQRDVAETINLKAGDYINIPAHLKHRVSWTDPSRETIWLAVFY